MALTLRFLTTFSLVLFVASCGGRSSLLAAAIDIGTRPTADGSPHRDLRRVNFDAAPPPDYTFRDISSLDANHSGYTLSVNGLARAVATDPLGNAYVAGHITEKSSFGPYDLEHHGMNDIFVAKVDPSGNFVWARSIGGTDLDSASGIVYSSASNALYVCGTFQKNVAFGSFGLVAGSTQAAFVARLDPASGKVTWVVQAGGPLFNDTGRIDATPKGEPLIVGTFESTAKFGNIALTSQGQYDIFIAKLNPAGAFEWATSAGGIDVDEGHAILSDYDGGAWVAGAFQQAASFGVAVLGSAGERDAFVAHVSSTGKFDWATSGGGMLPDVGESLQRAPNGAVVLGGTMHGPAKFGIINVGASQLRPFLATITATGTVQSLVILDQPTTAGMPHMWDIASVGPDAHLALWSGLALSRFTSVNGLHLQWTKTFNIPPITAAAMATDPMGFVVLVSGKVTSSYSRFKPGP